MWSPLRPVTVANFVRLVVNLPDSSSVIPKPFAIFSVEMVSSRLNGEIKASFVISSIILVAGPCASRNASLTSVIASPAETIVVPKTSLPALFDRVSISLPKSCILLTAICSFAVDASY